MSKPSKAGAAFLVVFAIPFVGMGTALMLKFLSPPDNTPNSIPGAIFAGGFALVGLLMIVGAIYGWQKLKQEAELKDQHPDAPWFWRQDWTQSRSDGQNRNRAVILWISTIVVSCLTLPWISVGLNSPKRNSPPPLFFAVLASFSLILAISAIRATIRRQRFGKTYFQFDSLPISPGKKLTGRIEVHLAADAQHGIDLRLSCIRRITTGSGKEQSTHDEVLWEGQQNIASAMLASGPLGNSVPVAFDVPVDAYESNYDNERDKVLWLLHAKADVPGIDFAEDYELPVFRTVPLAQPPSLTNSSTAFATQVGNASAAAPAPQSQSEPIEAPAKTSAVISTDWNGTQFYFPPLRNPLQTLMLFGFTAAWTGAVYLLHRSNAPLFFAIVFGAIDLLLIVAVLYSLFSSTRLELSNDTLVVRKSFLGIPRVSSIPFSEVALIHPVASMQSGTKSWYSLRLTTKAGRKLNLVDGIADRQEARWLVSQLETLAGLKQDTRVEFNDFYGPPPQRGVTPAPNALPARRGPARIAVVIFVAWLGFIVSRFVLPISRATHASTSVRPKTTAVQVLPRTFAPLTDADVERISVLPLQDQAEELLERSIEHDQQALDIFETHLAEYKGRVKESARMKQLLNRAQYSRDLRVRYAYCDMMLAMDGWSRDSDAVQILLERAKNDASSRAYDVWFLGMLGGRGVEPDQVRTALLDFAHNDPDAQVRQWATEGLRFLGTDQALDDLFEIFVSDPSYNVRDRAGCNLAEGGDFTRKQRMRIFPKFLELAENSTTNSLMRNWSFLAMQEITEVNLPPDAKAWRNWYEEHGVEKLAEFESLPEWQVRGDE